MWDLFLPIHTNAYLKVENMPAIGFEIKRKCKVCGEVFLAKTLDSQYCSPKCSKVAWKRKKDAKEKNEKLDRLAQHIPDIREYVSVSDSSESNAQPWRRCFSPEKKVLQKERNLCPEDTVWNQRTVIPLVRYATSTTSTTARYGRISANIPFRHGR